MMSTPLASRREVVVGVVDRGVQRLEDERHARGLGIWGNGQEHLDDILSLGLSIESILAGTGRGNKRRTIDFGCSFDRFLDYFGGLRRLIRVGECSAGDTADDRQANLVGGRRDRPRGLSRASRITRLRRHPPWRLGTRVRGTARRRRRSRGTRKAPPRYVPSTSASSAAGSGVNSPVSTIILSGLSSIASGRSTRPRRRGDAQVAKMSSVALSAFRARSSGSSPVSSQWTVSAITRSTSFQLWRSSSVSTAVHASSPARRIRSGGSLSPLTPLSPVVGPTSITPRVPTNRL
jgi:hypothetical protein